ncbi:transferase [Cronbergia sp. UHCC 0137]|uniref:transferase n=1 Tax=Cronbergia sp. UHCC 0137 TaxID=3110239 RepID=UPI002B20C7E3|nr:transferase [Cronbergia sp. UHCC 0137]MEA5616350.1 transferase [Cronbergia sp. UHCC 0137]
MSLPLLRFSNNVESYISGEVNIHPSAVLAPGVIIQAAVNSKIIIGPGVCIGMGSILQTNEGILEVETGVNLGAGFLMVGQGKIGANTCIGAATTVFNCSVASGQVIPAGSVLGDTSRQIGETQEEIEPSTINSTATETQEQEPQKTVISQTQFSASASVELKYQTTTSIPTPSPTPKSQSPPEEESPIQESEPSQSEAEIAHSVVNQIYGQGSINRLLTTLFPHRQSLNEPNSEG